MKTKVLIFDFSRLETEESAQELQRLLATINEDISILVNNVGVLHFGRLGDRDLKSINTMINVNVNAQTYMSLFLLPRLLQREKRSAVINLSSKAAFYTRGTMPMYCSTKRYNLALSRCMQDAYADKIDVLTVTPASVKTQMNPGNGAFTVQASEHGKAVIDHLGWHQQTWGSWWHAYQRWLEVEGPFACIYSPYANYLLDKNFRERAKLN